MCCFINFLSCMKATLGASEFSLTSNGKLSKKTTYLASVRQSYLQFLFKALGLPFLPTYTDAQFKTKTRLSQHNEITFLGLTGIDNMKLNTNLTGEKAEYILSYLPTVKQETFTLGSVYKHYAGAHIQTVVLSHSYLNNHLTKYLRNDESSPDNLTLKYGSLEQETKLRVENVSTFGAVKVSFGANLDHTQYSNNTFQKAYTDQSKTYKYHTFLDMLRWGFFGTMSCQNLRMIFFHKSHTTSRRSHHIIIVFEYLSELFYRSQTFIFKTCIGHRLAAAGLIHRIVNI